MNYSFNKEVIIPSRKIELEGKLTIPINAKGIVIFAHGSGSSRMSPAKSNSGPLFTGKWVWNLTIGSPDKGGR